MGGLLYLSLVILPWIYLFVTLRRRGKPVSLEVAGVLAALMAVSVVSLLDYYPWLLVPGRIWQWLLWALLGGLIVSAEEKERAHG